MPQNASGSAAKHDERIAPVLKVHRHQQVHGHHGDRKSQAEVLKRAVHVGDLAEHRNLVRHRQVLSNTYS